MKTKSYLCLLIGAAAIVVSSCKKSDNNKAPVDYPTLEAKVLVDFAGVLANPNYTDLHLCLQLVIKRCVFSCHQLV